MNFLEQQPIYQQIAEKICKDILQKRWKAREKIPSIRDTAIDISVNPNTVARSFSYLEQQNIIYKQRGVGYFVSEGSRQNILKVKREEFEKQMLPKIFNLMHLLQFELHDFEKGYDKFIKGKNNEDK